MAVTTIGINGVPVESYGLLVTSIDGWLNGPSYQHRTAQVIGRLGARMVTPGIGSDVRTISLEGYLQPSSLADRRTKLDALHRALTGRLSVTTSDNLTRECFAHLTNLGVKPVAGELWTGAPEAMVRVQLTCVDPLWYDVTPQSISAAAVATPVAFDTSGAAPYRRLKIILQGGVTNPTLTLKRATGATLATMRFTGVLTSAEYLEIDCDPDVATIKKWSGGTATDAMSWLNAADTFFAVDPLDVPTLEVSGTGATFIAYYFRAYWS